jgi:hypothetical protein
MAAIWYVQLGLDYLDAIELIRKSRPRAFNTKQIKFLKSFKPKKNCCIM